MKYQTNITLEKQASHREKRQ